MLYIQKTGKREEQEMFDKYIYNFLMFVNHWSTKLTSWSWTKLYADRKHGYGNKRRYKDSRDS